MTMFLWVKLLQCQASLLQTFKRRFIAFLAFNLCGVHGFLVLHEEKRTWSEAQEVCSEDGGTLVTSYTNRGILSLTPATETIWEGRYYSPWAWLTGCHSYNGSHDYVELKDNQLTECLNHCNSTNYFGLQNNKCFCLDTFDGDFKRMGDVCDQQCPGNKEERCGGSHVLTIYMNDICYGNSSQWQGTVSRTFTGKRCLPWTNVTAMQVNTLAVYPDGSAENASNFCRDPTNKTYLWCYVSQDEIEQCDIPKCISKDGIYPCMSFRKSGRIFYFTQEKCETTTTAVCETSEHILLWDRVIRTWVDARDQNRYTVYRDSGKSYYCYMMAGPGIFRLKTNLDYKTWFAYSRNFCTVSTIVPSREPQQCVGMYNFNGIVRSRVASCDERRAFICQYQQVTCGEIYNLTLNGTLTTPGYSDTGYDHNGRCIWKISVPDGYNIKLSINMSIEDTFTCRSDFLRISRGSYADGVSLCGNSTDDLHIEGSNVTIEFRSDGTINGRGANITWTSVPVVTEATTSVTREMFTLTGTDPAIVTDEDPNGDGNRFLMAGIPGETMIGIIVGVLVAFGFVSGILLVLRKRGSAIKTKECYASMVQTRDNSGSSDNPPPNQNINHIASFGSEMTTDQSYPELYDNAMFANEASVTECSSNIYHDTTDVIKPPLEGHTSNIYDTTSIERNQSFVSETDYDSLRKSGQLTLKGDSNSLDSPADITPAQESIIVEEAEEDSSDTDVYNKLNEVIKHEYENQPETVYMNQTETDCVYDQTSTCRRLSTTNGMKLPENNLYDHFTNYDVEYSKASACGRPKNVEDNMAMTDELTYDYLSKCQ